MTQNDDLDQKHERINSKLANQSVDSEIRELSKIHAEDHKSLLEPGQHSEDYNISSNTTRAQNEPNFITLGKIPEEEKIQIIKLGFQLNQQGKISLKKYYESTQQHSLFQLEGYSIKYETIRRTKLYLSLKP